MTRRLTNASPFIEDDTQRDIRTRVAERTVDWSCLTNAGISAVGSYLILKHLLVF